MSTFPHEEGTQKCPHCEVTAQFHSHATGGASTYEEAWVKSQGYDCPIFVVGWTQGKECGLQWEGLD